MKPDCGRYRDLLELLRDGALPPDEVAKLHAHRVACASCRRWEGETDAVMEGVMEQPSE